MRFLVAIAIGAIVCSAIFPSTAHAQYIEEEYTIEDIDDADDFEISAAPYEYGAGAGLMTAPLTTGWAGGKGQLQQPIMQWSGKQQLQQQPIVRTSYIDQVQYQPQLQTQIVPLRRDIDVPIVQRRLMKQPIVQQVINQPIIRRRIIPKTIVQQQFVDQPIYRPRVVEKLEVKPVYMQQEVQAQPIVQTVMEKAQQPIFAGKGQTFAQPLMMSGKGAYGSGFGAGYATGALQF